MTSLGLYRVSAKLFSFCKPKKKKTIRGNYPLFHKVHRGKNFSPFCIPKINKSELNTEEKLYYIS